MADLNYQHKCFVVRALAQFMTPTEVAEAVKDEFEGLIVTRQQVRYYNPEQSPELPAEWRELFDVEREKFKADMASIAATHQTYRIRKLNGMAVKAEQRKDFALAGKLLEQIARELGGSYTNRTELTGKDGGKVEVEITPVVTDYRQAVAALAPPDDAA